MAEISTVNGLSVNTVQNADLKRRYQRHISKILEISQKKSSVKLISDEQRKISDILKKSKEQSKHFKDREFMVKCEAENKRLLKSLSTINARQRAKTEREEVDHGHGHPQRLKTSGKEKVMRGFEIEMENRKLAQNIMENVCDVHDYRKRMKKEISEYLRLKTQMQRLKPVPLDKLTPPQDIHTSLKLKQKNLQNEGNGHEKLKTMAVREMTQH